MLKNPVDVVGLKNDWIKNRKILGATEYPLLKIKFVNIYSHIQSKHLFTYTDYLKQNKYYDIYFN